MLYIFDKDQTLIDNKAAPDRPANTPDEQIVLPGVIEALAALRQAGHTKTWMIGDQESDRGAAENALCRFAWAHEFFGWPSA